MFDSVKGAFSAYTKSPKSFLMLSLFYAAFQLLVSFALMGVFIVIFFIATFLNINIDLMVLAVISIIPVVLFFYFSSALMGSFIKHCSNLLFGITKLNFFDFFRYAVAKASLFFRIFLAKSLLILLLTLPIIALYLFYLKNVQIPYLIFFVAILILGISFLISFLFSFSFISAALYETNVFMSLKNSLKIIKTRHLFALILYIIYCGIFFTFSIPLANLITLFAFFPLVTGTMILFSHDLMKKSGKK